MNRNIVTATACIVAGIILAACKTNTEKVAPKAVTVLYDLKAEPVSAPSTAKQGQTITVIHTTKNVGTGTAPTSTSRFFICTNTVPCRSVNQQDVITLTAGASVTMNNTTFTIPSDQTLGTNYITVICVTNLGQDNKANNTNRTTIVITQ